MTGSLKRSTAILGAALILCLGIWALCRLNAPGDRRIPAGRADTTLGGKIDEQFVVARVESVKPESIDRALLAKTGILSRREKVKATVLEGPLAGKTVSLDNEVTDNPAYNINPEPGKELILSVVSGGGPAEINISDYHRAPVLLWLLIVFLGAFLFFGGEKGLKSLAGLLVCILLIALVLLPLALKGANPLLVSVLICLVAIVTSMLLTAGCSRKALAAMIGTAGGVVVAGVAAQIVIQAAPLTGLSSEEAQILRGSLLSQPPLFYSGLLAAGMLIGALGVIMDVGISIASSICEISLANQDLSREALYRSGMNVGRDIMGTMTNTLVLAYAGSALPLLMLVSQMPSIKLFNLDLVATEIASSLTGSLGLTLTIPLTAWASSRLMARSPGHLKGAGSQLDRELAHLGENLRMGEQPVLEHPGSKTAD